MFRKLINSEIIQVYLVTVLFHWLDLRSFLYLEHLPLDVLTYLFLIHFCRSMEMRWLLRAGGRERLVEQPLVTDCLVLTSLELVVLSRGEKPVVKAKLLYEFCCLRIDPFIHRVNMFLIIYHL